MRLLALIACAGLGIAATAAAKEEQPQQQEGDKIICKRQGDADTGSHFSSPKKVCRTKTEWKEMEDAAEQTLHSLNERAGGLRATGAGPH